MIEDVGRVMDLPAEEGVNEKGGAFLSQQYFAIASAPHTASTATQLHDSQAKVIYFRESDPASKVQGIDPDAFFEASYSGVLDALIDQVINEEGPILDVILARRITRAHGWVRTGSKIRLTLL